MHEVGQVIFLVSRKAQSVLSAQICEQNVKKTLEGEETTFRVKIGGDFDSPGDMQIYDLDRVDADIFGSPEEASDHLMQVAKSAIDELVNSAVEDASRCFAYKSTPTKKVPTKRRSRKPKVTKAPEPAKEEAATFITMPDGTQARLRTPIENIGE